MTTHFDSINAECELKTAFQVGPYFVYIYQ